VTFAWPARPRTRRKHGKGSLLRLSGYGEETLTARDQEYSNVIRHVDEVDNAWHQPAKDEDTKLLVHSLQYLIECWFQIL
jgi:hypothetical protein